MKLFNFLKIKTYWFFAFEYKKDGKTFHRDLVTNIETYFWQNIDASLVYSKILKYIIERFETKEIRIRQFNRV